VLFKFRKVSEEELVIADQLKDILRKTREAFADNYDQRDPAFVSLYDELKRLFNKKNLDEITQEEMRGNIDSLQQLFDKISELNRKNNLLKAKYENDEKYARIHKRILEKGDMLAKESEICDSLLEIKKDADERILINSNMLSNESYFEGLLMPIVINRFESNKQILDTESAKYINIGLVREYVKEYQGVGA
jgi:type I restriction enzyme R subunit